MKIDAVITWVDGDDPQHESKRRKYGSAGQFKVRDVAGKTRYASVGEIFWCVASLNRFAPWLNRIYIVTDEQDPGLDAFLEANFPQGYIPYEIVDHKVVFRGYEDYLPTFNSISIETMTWRIPGLSDQYIEFNDDLMLTDSVSPEDFFTSDGNPICIAEKNSILFTRITRMLKPARHGILPVTAKGSHLNGAILAGQRFWFLRLAHCQKALRRDFFERYYSDHPEALIRNISHRFRNTSQYTPQAFQYVSLLKRRTCRVISPAGKLFYFMPKGGDRYFDKKMKKLNEFKGCYACFNSIDLATENQQRELVRWIENRLCVKF